jgi:uncharacterized protein YjbI with pentapeptide repeats
MNNNSDENESANKSENIYEEIDANRIRLTNRWQSAECQIMLKNVIQSLQSNQHWAGFLSELPDIEDVFTGWDLRGAFLEELNFFNVDFKEVFFIYASLKGSNLESCDFRGASFGYTNLSEANLVDANFEGCIMLRTNLSKANLSNAQLAGAVLMGSDLSEANFSGADLTSANLVGSKLEGAIFEGAILHNTRFGELAKET